MSDPTSPSEPVESREQPRGEERWPEFEFIDGDGTWRPEPKGIRSQTSTPAKSPWPQAENSAPHAPRNYPPQNATTFPPNVGQGTPDDVIAGLRSLLAERAASIRNLETLRDVHRRTIDDLISEAQTAGATIDELRAEVERRLKPWQDRDIYATMTRAEPAMRDELLTAWAARDDALAEVERLKVENHRCREMWDRSGKADLLAEVSRLREQGEAVRRLADQIEVEIAPFHSDDETVVDRIRAALGDAREGE